jgi:hypothetical protein
MAYAIAAEVVRQLPPHKDKTEHQMPGPTHRPTSGRTTAQGRKVEKPGDASPAGPSGQPSHTQDTQGHTNK